MLLSILKVNVSYLLRSFLLLCLAFTAAAQQQSQYDKGTPPQHAAGVSSFGSYVSADIGTINLANGSLNLSIPLANVGGRGFWIPITLNYSSKVWSASKDKDIYTPQQGGPTTAPVVFADYIKADFSIDFYNRIAAGWTIGAQPLLRSNAFGLSPFGGTQCGTPYMLTKLTLVMPDKGEVEFRDDLTDGAPLHSLTDSQGCFVRDGARGERWHATDGSGAIFISDALNGVVLGNLSGVVITDDGMRYRFSNVGVSAGVGLARCVSITDRNGNVVEITYPSSSEVSYKDQLGRVTTVQRDVADPEGLDGQLAILVTFKGYNGQPAGQPRYYKIKTGAMRNSYRSDINPTLPVVTGDADDELASHFYEITSPHTELFPNSWGKFVQNIDGKPVVSSLILPDRRKLDFAYNEYGEVAEVRLPAGGKIQYDYGSAGLPSGNTLQQEKRTSVPLPSNVNDIDRAVVTRRTLPDGVTVETNWQYGYGQQAVAGTTYACTTVTARAGSPTGTLLLDQRHFFLAAERYVNSLTLSGTNYRRWSTGVEWRTETRDSSGSILAAVERDWTQRAPVTWPTGYAQESGQVQEQPANDNRVNETRNILATGSQSRTTTLYDGFNNPTQISEFDYDNTLKRRTQISYLTTNNGYAYQTDDAVHLLRLPEQQSVFDGAGTEESRTVYQYDKYQDDTLNGLLIDHGVVTQHDVTYGVSKITRGNVTATGKWLNTTGGTIYSYTHYDTLGNVISIRDPKGNISLIDYADDFGVGALPGSGVIGPAGATFAFPTLVTSPRPNSGEAVQTARSQYDFATGLLTGFKDRNGIISQTIYDDPFNRPTLVKEALGLVGLETRTAMYYAPTTVFGVTLSKNDVLTARDQNNPGDANLRSWSITDGFGRTKENWTRDLQGDVKVEVGYDGLGRVAQMSNPFRPSLSETAFYTTTTYDLAGRIKNVTSPGNAVVISSYVGNAVTVQDQAGNLRRSITDGLGRLIEVHEPDNTNDLGSLISPKQRTIYQYNARDQLTQVTQGGQIRSFVYDSLSRLTSATNPETCDAQGVPVPTTYKYDDNGNLVVKTDARNASIHYSYDGLNRVTRRWYNGSSDPTVLTHNSPALPVDVAATDELKYYYDSQALPNGAPSVDRGSSTGRLVATTFGGSTSIAGNYGGYDSLGRVKQSIQTTDGTSYSFVYSYDLAGNLRTQTYPSGRIVETEYNTAGKMAGVKNQSSGKYYAGAAPTDSVNRIQYAAHGAISQMRLANNDSLWEHTTFNARLQPTQIGLGTSATDSSKLQLDYTYSPIINGVADPSKNNGNLRTQTVTGGGFTATQSYSYDYLNRLVTASEGTAWSQTYDFDRWGNRSVRVGSYLPNSALTPQSANATDFSSFEANTNRLSKIKFPSVTYDKAGNLKTDQVGSAFIYDAENRQVTAAVAGQSTTYIYDGDGHRIKKVTVAATTVFVYNLMGQLVAEYSSAPPPPSGTKKYLVADQLGTPRVITDATGTVLSRHDYLPFGEELFAGIGSRTTPSGFSANDLIRQQFTEFERDGETGLDYAINRYYSASQGRFSGADPYNIVVEKENGQDDKERSQILLNYCLQPQIWNKYTYSLNNPFRYVDPDGRRPRTELDLARIKRLTGEYEKAKQAGDADLANAISQAVSEIGTAIDAVPEGQEDPSNLKTVFFAIDQLGAKSFATNESNRFSMNGWEVALGPGDNKCNFFVAMSWALGGGIGLNGEGNTKGVPVYGTKGGVGGLWGNGYVPGANEWSGGRVQNFTRVTAPQLGDVAAWGSKGQGHSGIYVGGGAVIYAHIFEGVKIQSVQFVNSKQNTQAAFNRYKP
jgi:RHS repeat-associated protein